MPNELEAAEALWRRAKANAAQAIKDERAAWARLQKLRDDAAPVVVGASVPATPGGKVGTPALKTGA